MEPTSFTRNDLYELIWEKPMNKFISIYGGSYSDVKKMLAKNLIPLPPVGYWSKLRQGIEVSKTPLPPIPDISDTIIYSPKEKKIVTGGNANKNTKQHNLPKIPLDRLVVDAKKAYTEALRNPRAAKVISIGYDSLDIFVSKELLDRALNFFNRLIFEVKKQGGSVCLGPQITFIRFDRIDINVSVREKTKRIKNWTDGEYGTYGKLPTGILIVKAGINSWESKEWIDQIKIIDEDTVIEVIQFVNRVVEKEIEKDKKEAEFRIVYAEQRRKFIDLEERRKTEAAKFLSFKKNFERWDTAKRMRQYLAELERSAIDNNTFDETLKNYLDWAKEKIDWYDPMVNKNDELLDGVNKDTLELKEKSAW